MNIIITINGASKTPMVLSNLLKGSRFQPIDIDEVLDEDDLDSLEAYIDSLNAKHVYVLYSQDDSEIQSLQAIKRLGSIKVDAFFTCL